jgi:hypothetical protein
MANKTMTITAPEELIQATITAYAAKGQKPEGVSDEDHAIEMMIDVFREEIVSYLSNQERMRMRLEQRSNEKTMDDNLKSQRDQISVTIVSVEAPL